ncbi:serine/threonine protein kinase [Streptomonospora litoralis]|uniref:Serine/threonine-protein kinase AfsK n=1 Tax=Streptomonospora litoralis TaxID=2498135 RepID=A0A4P6Q3M0_9ACTN|nr:serine/threonine-protein kinase [Streptomonospora litoralis]QBI55153.1 Serine/threonine-protein kinase AfsK [Streptomonospora litoralis]
MPAGRPLHAGDPASVGGYRLTGRLGQGGQGVVYLGTAPDGTEVAVKVLSAEWAEDPGFRRRFEREARAARQVASFCTAQVLDASFEVAQPYIVSEYVHGPSLKEAVERQGPTSGAELHRLAVATATALVAVHEAGIVHRDFKPANVLMANQGPRVIDFGIAQTGDVTGTQTQSVIGTPGFMAPEQIAGEAVSQAVDVFAWGAVMVFAATGRAPFSGDSIPAVIHQVMSATPDLQSVEEPWRSVVEQCLAKDPGRRPSSAELLMRLLGRRDSGAAEEPHASGPGDPAPDAHVEAGGDAPGGARSAAQPAADGIPARSAAAPAKADTAAAGGEAGESGDRRSPARKRLAVTGAALALLLVVGAGGYAAWAARSPDTPSADQDVAPQNQDPVAAAPSVTGAPSPTSGASPSPQQSPSAAAEAQADVSAAETPSMEPSESAPQEDGAEGGSGESEEDKVTFSAEFAGRWVGHGTFPNGTQRSYDLVIEAGSRTASVTTSDNACRWAFEIFRTNNKGGYDGWMNTGAGCGPHKGGGFWIDGGRLVVMLWGEQGNFEPHFFWLDRP